MNKKIRANAAWNGLSAEQRATLERWLFEERLSFKNALIRARQELGFAGSIGSLKRFYHRTADARMLQELPESAAGAGEAETRRVAMRAVGQLFLRQVTENPDDFKEWAPLARLVLQSEQDRLRHMLDAEKNAIWRGGLTLAREKFEFDAAAAALKHLANRPEMDAEELERERARVEGIRKRLFGRDLPEKPAELAQPEQPAPDPGAENA